MAKKKEQTKKRFCFRKSLKEGVKTCFRGKNIVITILVVLFVFQYVQTNRILGDFSLLRGHSSSLIDEIGQLKETNIRIGEDLNEVRSFLRMPTSSYGFEDFESEESKDEDTNELQLAFFRYVDHLAAQTASERALLEHREMLSSLADSEDLQSFLGGNDLFLTNLYEDDEVIRIAINDEEGRGIAAFDYSKEDEALFFEFFTQKEKISADDPAQLQNRITKFINEEMQTMQRAFERVEQKRIEIAEALSSEEVSKLKEEKNISIDERFVIRNAAGDIIGGINMETESGRIALEDKSNEDLSLEVTDIKGSLVSFLEKLDTRTSIERRIDEAKADIEETISDGGFQLLLSDNDMSISPTPREDNTRFYYDIFDGHGNAISSIAVDKATGTVYITNPDGTSAQNIFFFEPESKKKTLNIPDNIPDYGAILSDGVNEGSLNILVAGTDGALLDAMIFVHINHDRGDIRMISIPRDLFYQGRKINAFAHFYGMDELKRVISDITGYRLDKYISIDMMAFMEVIDIIGGVEVTLERSLIDPTYRVRDNGRVSTLHYESGTYHFSGVEALRIARSRYTTSDFARAERQQLILEAVQRRAREFGFGDTDTIYQIIRSVLRKTKTDISLDEAIVWFFRYQNYDIKGGNVMSSGNILYVPPYITAENCRRMIEEAEEAGEEIPDCENQNQAYTLLPRNDDWNIIRWYFREIFED